MNTVRTPADIGNVIRATRKRLGWDQARLANEIGASRQWIVDVEKGKPRAELQLILRALHVLGLEVMLAQNVIQAPDLDKPDHRKMLTIDLDEIIEKNRLNLQVPIKSLSALQDDMVRNQFPTLDALRSSILHNQISAIDALKISSAYDAAEKSSSVVDALKKQYSMHDLLQKQVSTSDMLKRQASENDVLRNKHSIRDVVNSVEAVKIPAIELTPSKKKAKR
ncbi:helix-turn-helix transcriptional regulator [Xanthomonas nasturtii]|uniref:helix-turn-helix transcriptional regulator n=1 Tax=Xanthomonas nasturtii TaxID=1843581 RepID=UPI002012B1A2|nr:helix-turn-helix transcriptional regulator [Xanthomonas nasturtii]MCL1499821.1 helix-turn-helix transcriptional regulator [Xanthomonas nasturtii]MCL1503393.1 helix-turn-helix transcriptional regulator [Xanthomonas nasturtii]MCL1521890.1 helix-turn-helix transcriptional regulator [Xanthomonas nasturtii]